MHAELSTYYLLLGWFEIDEGENYEVTHIILMLVCVLSAIIGTIATSLWIRSLLMSRNGQGIIKGCFFKVRSKKLYVSEICTSFPALKRIILIQKIRIYGYRKNNF